MMRADKQELLRVLGHVYAITSVGYKKISLNQMMDRYAPSCIQKQAFIRAVYEMGILLKEDDHHRHPRLHWDKEKCGVPSLTMVESLIARADKVMARWYENKKNKEHELSLDRFSVEVSRATRKKPCRYCPFAGSPACELFKAQGFDCRKYNMETFMIGRKKDETGVGQ